MPRSSLIVKCSICGNSFKSDPQDTFNIKQLLDDIQRKHKRKSPDCEEKAFLDHLTIIGAVKSE